HHVIDEAGADEAAAQIASDYTRVPGLFTIGISDGRNPPVIQFLATVVADDPDLDLAVLQIGQDSNSNPVDPASLNLPFLRLGSVKEIDIGDPLHVIGFPVIGSGSLTYTDGIVSGFLYEDGIDGPAWLNTDAVMSGGVSGGVAVDESGALIGVPTSGTPLDCRPGDTNGDGVEDAQDTGCVPTGGSLGQVRPIDLALPLLRSVDPGIAPATGPDPAAAVPSPVTDATTAAACAQRGDWRCASRIYRLAYQTNPGDPTVAAAFYDALLGLAALEEDSGQLGAARDAYTEAAALDPARAEAAQAANRLAPYAAIRYADGFTESRYRTSDDADGSASYDGGDFTMSVRTPGRISTFPLGDQIVPDGNFSLALDIISTSGQGATLLSIGDWLVLANPNTGQWGVLQLNQAEGEFQQWLAEADYTAIAGPGLSRMEIRVIGGIPTLLINGIDVSATQGAVLPAFTPGAPLGFGATMTFDGSDPFTMTLDRVALYDLP
ncbi:MAG: trypsin-like peptidase domain-containing protein, partial [Thermomicrobiales bacterium]